jgi:hypothetical protein
MRTKGKVMHVTAPVSESHVVAAAGAQGQPHASSTGLRHAGEGPTGRERH